MPTLSVHDDLARAVVEAIRSGDLVVLGTLLADEPWLARVWLDDNEPRNISRSLLHIVTDWPGHFPRGAETVRLLVAAGADVDARVRGPHTETPLHWAASCDDVEVLDALLDAGADIDARGAVIGGGTPLADARAFRQWSAALRLVERGATVDLFDAATLGLADRLAAFYQRDPTPAAEDTDLAFWSACHGGRLDAARYLLARGADIDAVPPWEPLTPLDAAMRGGPADLVAWLRENRAHTSSELRGR